MTLGVIFNQKSNKASEPQKRVFLLSWILLWSKLVPCLGTLLVLPTVELGSIPLWRFGHVLSDRTCHEATHHFKFAGLYGSIT